MIIKEELNTGQKLCIKKKVINKPNFIMCGNGVNKNSQIKAVDMAEKLMEFNDVEKFAFKILYKKIKKFKYNQELEEWYLSCIVDFVASKHLSKTDAVRFSKGIRLLMQKKLVIKLKRSEFMVNPNMIIPTYFVKENNIWEQKQLKNQLQNK